MVEILSAEVVDGSLSQTVPVYEVEVGAVRAPYSALSPDDFELLLYALFKHAQPQQSVYDRVTLMITGADRGRDVWLTKGERPAGLVQCKRTGGISVPQAIREVIKFLLFAQLDPRLQPDEGFIYHLAVSQDPAATTVDLFDAPSSWLAANEAQMEGQIESVIGNYASFAGMDTKAITPAIFAALNAIQYQLIRPVDLDALLDESSTVRRRFFRTRMVMDVANVEDMLASVLGRASGIGHAAETETVDVAAELSRASQLLAHWPQDIWGSHINRPELKKLLHRIDEHPAGATLLVGSAGTGKSALLAELYAALASQPRLVFAIKADTLDPAIVTIDDLAEALGLTAPLDQHLLSLAGQAPLVILIDQLDAISEVMDQSSQRMQVLLQLVTQLRAARGLDGEPLPVHSVVSSRPFEARFDARFQQLDADDVNLSLPPYERVEELLSEIGIDPTRVPATLQETLRTPFALGLYVDLAKLGGSPEELTPGNLLDRWLERKLPSGSERATFLTFLRHLAGDMTEQETLWRPAALYEPEFSQVVRTTEAAGLIKREGDMIGFAHQSWLDDFQAKRFATGASLTEFAWSRQDGLFARGTVLRGLEHLRKVDRQACEAALRLLLVDPQTRRHLRHLAADFVASATDPSPQEIVWIEWMFRSDQSLANRAAGKVAQSWSLWREGVKPLLPFLMQAEQHQWNAISILIREAVEDPDGVLDLIDRYWNEAAKDEAVYRIIEQAPLLSSRSIARLRQIFERTPIADWAVSNLVMTFASAGAVQVAIEIAAMWADLQGLDRYNSLRLHELDKVAAQAPLFFARTFMPWFVRVASRELDMDDDCAYPRSRSLPYYWKYDAEQGAITGALRASLKEVASNEPDTASALLNDYVGVEVDEVQSLIADTLAENPSALRTQAVEFLTGDRRRLKLGQDSLEDADGISHFVNGWSTGNLIEALGPMLSDPEFAAIRERIEVWQPYEIELLSGLGRERLRWQRWAEEQRLELLSKLPPDRLEPRRRRQIAEWASTQPRYKRKRGIGMAKFVGSPMSHEQMANASDDALMGMLDKVSDSYDHRAEFRRFMLGGVTELSRAFATFAKENPSRAIPLIRDRLKAELHERAAGEAIRELVADEATDPAVLKDLIWHLHGKGFSSQPWRENAASTFNSLAERMKGLEDRDLDLLRGWLDRDAEVIAERAARHRELRAENRARNEKPDQIPSPFLFGHGGGISIIPQWNHTILSAIASGLLAREEPDCAQWLVELEKHVEHPEDPEVWSSIVIRQLQPLWWADNTRTTALLDALFARFPQAFEDANVIVPLWRFRSRLSEALKSKLLAFWTSHDDRHLRQAAGEFATAFTIVYGDTARNEVRMVETLLANGDLHPRVGVLFAAAAGWREDDLSIRARSHALLMTEAGSVSGFEAHALSTAIDQKHRLAPDAMTGELLAQLLKNEALLSASIGHFFVENLQGLLLYPGYEEIVLAVVERMADLALGDGAGTSRGVLNGDLVGLAVTLQRTPAGIRERAMTLYERLLDHAVYGAEEAATSALRR